MGKKIIILGKEFNPNDLDFKQWIQSNIENRQVITDIIEQVGDNPEWMHIYFDYAEETLRTWNSFPSTIIPHIVVFLKKYTLYCQYNLNLEKYVSSYHIHGIMRHNKLLEYLDAHLPVHEIDIHMRVILINYFQSHLMNHAGLQAHRGFFKKVLESFFPDEKNRLVEWIRSPVTLITSFQYPINQAYELYFGFSLGTNNIYWADDKETSLIKSISAPELLDYLMVMQDGIYFKFISRFHQRNGKQGEIRFSEIPNITKLSQQKRFFLSIISSTKLFETQENSNFIEFIITALSNKDEIIGEFGISGNIPLLFSYFESIQFNLFEDTPLHLRLLATIAQSRIEFYTVFQYINNSNYLKITSVGYSKKVYDIFKNSDGLTLQRITGYILNQACKTLRILEIIELYNYMNVQEISRDHKNYFMDKIQKIQGLRYKEIQCIIHFIDRTSGGKYNFAEYLEVISSNNSGKVQYIIAKNQNLFRKNNMSRYDLRQISERYFFASLFPISLYHWMRMQFE